MSETAYYNGRVYTSDKDRPVAQAFIVCDGRFKEVGDNNISRGCENKVDLKGQCVIPGLVDSHCHMFAGITEADMDIIYVDSSTKPSELGRMLSELAGEKEYEEGETIAAMGIDLTRGEFSAENIDGYISDHPVIVFSDDGHALLLNSKSMETIGIDENTKDPGEHSYFARNRSGIPTGLVIEIPAMMQCKKLLANKKSDPSEILKMLSKQYASYGYTTVFEAMSSDSEDYGLFEVLKNLSDRNELKLRISTSFCYHGEDSVDPETAIKILRTLRDSYSGTVVFNNTLKIIVDGTIEEHSALLYEPYSDSKGSCGNLMIPEADMERIIRMAGDAGFNIHVHAIGDRAAGIALRILNSLGEISGTKTIAHNQLYGNEEIKAITGTRDIFFQTTPHWVEADDFTLNALGKKRYEMQFPMHTMIKNDVPVSFGSDSCLDENTADPFRGMYFAVSRGEASSGDMCFPPKSEGISREEALLAYTINGARQLKLSSETGSIEEGKSADFVILDRDIMNCALEDLKTTSVKKTFFRGEQIHGIRAQSD